MGSWIKLGRSLQDWEWYGDHNATRLLIHLLISVNYEDKKWKGTVIKAGSMVLSWDTLASRSGLSKRQCRTAMEKLESSKEVTRSLTRRFQVVTLIKWEKLQVDDRKVTANSSGRGQDDDRKVAPTKEDKEIKEYKNILKIIIKENSKKLFEDWIDYRKEIKRPIKSEKTKIALAKKINNNGYEKSKEVINHSIENGYQGLFWDRQQNNQKEKISGKKEKPSAADKIRKNYGIN